MAGSNVPPQVMQVFQRMQQDYRLYIKKIGELEAQKDEHGLVLKQLEKLDPTRRCYRSVGGVLVERTVAEVLPAVKTNLENIQITIENITEQLSTHQKEMNEFALANGLVGVKTQSDGDDGSAAPGAGASQSVLV